jgi:hypothetical protein
MRLTRHFPRNYEALRDLILKTVGDSKSVVFQAGHFLLIYDETTGTISPCIHGDTGMPGDSPLAANFGRFPILTWQLALKLLDDLSTPEKNLMIVSNDWQYLPKGIDRSDFYSSQAGKLPKSYSDSLYDQKGSVSVLEPLPVKNGISTAPFFGEMNLRNRYQRRVSKLVESGSLPSSAIIDRTEGRISCKMPGLSGAMEEFYCSGQSGDCAAEIAEMLCESHERTNADVFVNLYPIVCQDFVEQGVLRSFQLFKTPFRAVLNLGFPSSGISTESELLQGCEASLHSND